MISHLSIHHLSKVDYERRTAVCSVCGSTRIHVANSKTHSKPKISCINRARASNQARNQRIRDEKRSQNPNWKPRHSLSGINVKKMTAVCAVCGATEIRKRKLRQSTIYICATKKRAYAAEYRQDHFPPHPRAYSPSAHVLSEIDDEKKTAVCSRCGPVKIYVAQSRNSVSRRCSKANILAVMKAQEKRRERDEKAPRTII